jgi:hypothetical protein
MKKVMLQFIAAFAIIATIYSCEKSSAESNNNQCNGENAFLLPDSITRNFCQPNYSYFTLSNPSRTVKLYNQIVAIDTIVNGGYFNIQFDSVGNIPCAGAIMKEIELSCFTRLP